MSYCADYLWNAHGSARSVPLPATATGAARFAIAGIPNIHSHAFQRAMAGLAERAGPGEDSFWTWREAMYACAQRMDPDRLRAVAAQLYAEMLEAGFTWVCEFHYLHHQPGGRAYAPAEAMAVALVEAARETGIGLTLLPVLYQRGGFDDRALDDRQQRFSHDTAAFLRLLETLAVHEGPRLRLGTAFHSLRAVSVEAMREVLATESAAQRPLHIHIAEQIGEVQECLARHKARPVDWLCDQVDIDRRWTLVHATHLSAEERMRIARSGAVVALCPTTEANLGDGLFPLREYLSDGGRFGIGSDSHISVSPVEELRWLEYGQRLIARRRNRVALEAGESCGEVLLGAALGGGWQATGVETPPDDIVVLEDEAPALAGASARDLVDRWVFASQRPLVREVYAGGVRVVERGRHVHADALRERFARVMRDTFSVR
ncbi:MAG TPA: formimidoylglutamate deiminase [Xanthomonadaceae bacterium]|nr:formimidoylglutamate deiminase [Xanthomonadaceae bacterium]